MTHVWPRLRLTYISNGTGLVGEGDGLVLPDDELLLGGEGRQVLGAAQGGGGQEEQTSYTLDHLHTILCV